MNVHETNNKENKDVKVENFFTKKEAMYYVTINDYFRSRCSSKNIEKMIDIINGDSEISLRVLDWVVTKYAKTIMGFKNDNDDFFDMHISYKAQLRSYKKTYFDPFRRYHKFNYRYDSKNKKKKILTTLGQLNFFKWAFSNGIINYVEKNLELIIKAMVDSNKKDKKKKKDNSDSESDENLTDTCSDEKSSKSSKKMIVKNGTKIMDTADDEIFSSDTGKIILHFG